ncbi:MAG TPA: O-antigen ligase family protein [Symbiobacteriaceae bacterium]|nr:O-antigen ligase family protein [Symbiobacteriaceae bacterium]
MQRVQGKLAFTGLVTAGAIGILVAQYGVASAWAFGLVAITCAALYMFYRYPEFLLAIMFTTYYPLYWGLNLLGVLDTSTATTAWLAVALVVMMLRFLTHASAPYDRKALAAFLLMTGIIVGSWLWRSAIADVSTYLTQFLWLLPLMVGPFCSGLTLDEGRVRRFVQFVIALSVVFVLIVGMEALAGRGFVARTGRLTPFGGLFNPITTGYVLGYASSASLPWVLAKRRPGLVAVWAMWFAVALILIILTGSRQALVLLVAAILLTLSATYARRYRILGIALVAAAVTLFGLLAFSATAELQNGTPLQRFAQLLNDPIGQGENRIARWAAAIKVAGDTAFLGGGFGASYGATDNSGVHNVFLEALSDYGVLGVILLLFVHLRAMRLVWATLLGENAPWWRHSVVVMYLTVLGGSLVSGRLTAVSNLWVATGVILSLGPIGVAGGVSAGTSLVPQTQPAVPLK